MAVDKLVDSTQLDADLTSVANAIRAKGGTSADLAFPSGFVSAVHAINTGDGFSVDDILAQDGISGDITIAINHTPFTTLQNRTAITSVTIINNVMIGSFFKGCTGLKRVIAPKVTSLYGNNNTFQNCSSLETIYFPLATAISQSAFESCVSLEIVALPSAGILYNRCFAECSSLTTVDLGPGANISRQDIFYNCVALKALVLRKSNGIMPLGTVAAFSGSPFEDGGDGGTVYVPKAMYDHLGDGSNLDYKAATNWSTLDGYGTITWAQIEGSNYETQYADGTPIT